MNNIELATSKDTEDVLAVVQDACDRLREKNVEQWPSIFPKHLVEQWINNGEFYVLRGSERPVAAFRLLWEDSETWGEDDGLAGFIHTLSVHRDIKGTGAGAMIIGWAKEEVLRNNRTLLRLDCVAHNTALKNYYFRLGFREVGVKEIGKTKVVLLEK